MSAPVVVVLSGEAPRETVEAARRAGARVVAADGGGNALAAWGLAPDAVIGDMDSIRPDVLASFEEQGVRVERHPTSKLHTDGALAVDDALAAGARDILLVGATGGRLDHVIANLQLLRRGAERGARMRASEPDGDVWTVTAATPLALALPDGATVSVLALTDAADGVTLDGFRYPLAGARMESGDPFGVSNVAAGTRQRVSCATGVLAVVVPRGPRA